jgi:hypothetical protein
VKDSLSSEISPANKDNTIGMEEAATNIYQLVPYHS